MRSRTALPRGEDEVLSSLGRLLTSLPFLLLPLPPGPPSCRVDHSCECAVWMTQRHNPHRFRALWCGEVSFPGSEQCRGAEHHKGTLAQRKKCAADQVLVIVQSHRNNSWPLTCARSPLGPAGFWWSCGRPMAPQSLCLAKSGTRHSSSPSSCPRVATSRRNRPSPIDLLPSPSPLPSPAPLGAGEGTGEEIAVCAHVQSQCVTDSRPETGETCRVTRASHQPILPFSSPPSPDNNKEQ